MDSPQRADGQPQTLLARTLHVARLLLSERPDQIDALIAGSKVTLRLDTATDRSVIAIRNGASTSYWVAERGTITTRQELPDWADEADVHELQLPDVQGLALESLKETADQLRAASPSLYEELRVREIVDAADSHYNKRDAPAFDTRFHPIPLPVEQIEPVLASADEAQRWLESTSQAVQRLYLSWRLPFEPTYAGLATLTLLQHVDDPRPAIAAGILRTVAPMARALHEQAFAGNAANVREHVEAFPVELDAVYLPLEPDFYAVGLELSGSGGLDATQRAMRFLEWAADRQLDAARREASIERFYVELAHAGLLYRAADAICAFLTDLAAGGNRDTAELESRRVIYEERRVTIVGSFFHAASFHWDVNPTWPPSIGAWIDALATLPPTTARAIVHDYALKLIIPGYMRDLVLGSVWRLTGDTQNALQALQRAHEQLTANHQLSPPLPWEPNLLLALSDELARAHQSLGT